MSRNTVHTVALVALLFPSITLWADISHRKADLEVKVQAFSGTPLEGAAVEITMLNHSFRFGVSVEHHLVNPSAGTYKPKTVESLEKYFNSMTYGNVMKWTYFESRTEAQNLSLAALPNSFHAFNGLDPLRLRGHATIWGASYQVPTRVRNSDDESYIHGEVFAHIDAYHSTFRDAGIDNFDLYNEPFHERALLIDKVVTSGAITEEAAEIATWFQRAKQADPEAILFINEYNILNFWQEDDRDVHAYKTFVDAVRDAGGPIDGIGLQAHMDRMITKDQMRRRFDILSAPMAPTDNHPEGLPGLPLEITEYDINLSWNPTPQQQADLTDNLLEASFEHPAVDGITLWGMNDSDHWRGNALIFDDSDPANWIIKPSGQSYIDHVKEEWWENHSGTSAKSGNYTATTFKGTHKVVVTFQGETKESIVYLDSDDTVDFEFAATAADATTYEAWVDFINWGLANPDNSLRTGDPDGDGYNNLHEFVFGMDPLTRDRAQSPKLYLVPKASEYIEYAIRARHERLSVELARSSNLVDWTTVPLVPDQLDFSDGLAYHTVNLSQPDLRPPLPDSSIFFRIQVTEDK